MELKTKKIVAREILILLLAITIGLCAYLAVYPYNSHYQSKTQTINAEYTKWNVKHDSLINTYETKFTKQINYINEFSDDLKISYDVVMNNLFNKYGRPYAGNFGNLKFFDFYHGQENPKSPIVSHKGPQSIWNPEPLTDIEFQNLVKSSYIAEIDLKNYQTGESLKPIIDSLEQQQRHFYYKPLSTNAQNYFALNAFGIALLILFGLRYLYYIVRWSIKTLKQ